MKNVPSYIDIYYLKSAARIQNSRWHIALRSEI